MTFHYLLLANQSIYQRQLMDSLKSTELTPGQPKVLDYLRDHDGATQKEIAAACFLEAATITSVLNGMEAKGMIERRRLNGNRRSFHIFMTPKGQQLQKQIEQVFLRLEEKTFQGIPQEQQTVFMDLFTRLYETLKFAE